MNKLITGIGILFLSGMVSASAQMQYVDNDACQDDLSLSTPKFTREASPLDTLRKYILTPKAPDTPRIKSLVYVPVLNSFILSRLRVFAL